MTARSELKKTLEANGLFYDRLTAKKDGTFEVKRSYFYYHGFHAKDWGAKVQAALDAAGVRFKVVDTRDDWRVWPKDSFLVAVARAQD